MKLYHYTRRENVLNMYKEGIRPCSFWCRSIEDCKLFLGLYMKAGLIPSPCDIAFVSIDFEEEEIIESDDHDRNLIDCDAFFCPKRIDKTRMPKLFDIPLYSFSIK